jgi:hypothetical protein
MGQKPQPNRSRKSRLTTRSIAKRNTRQNMAFNSSFCLFAAPNEQLWPGLVCVGAPTRTGLGSNCHKFLLTKTIK